MTTKKTAKKPVKTNPTVINCFFQKVVDDRNYVDIYYLMSDGTHFNQRKWMTVKRAREYVTEIVGKSVGYEAEYYEGYGNRPKPYFNVSVSAGSDKTMEEAIEVARKEMIESLESRIKMLTKDLNLAINCKKVGEK